MGVVDNYTWDMENEIGLGLVSEVSEDTLYLDVSVYQFFFKGVYQICGKEIK
jgi:hypothetical protein